MRKQILLASLLLAASTAQAGQFSCQTPSDLDDPNGDCGSNAKYADAGFDCLEKLEALIQTRAAAAKLTLLLSNAKTMGGGNERQSNSFAGSDADYKIAMSTLDSLIASAQAARKNVSKYLPDLYYPDEFDAPEEIIGDGEQFLKNSQCYAEPKSLVEQTLKDMDQHIEDLKKAKLAAAQLGKASQTNLGKVDDLDGTGEGVPTGGASVSSTPRIGKDYRPSDVTGTEKVKKHK